MAESSDSQRRIAQHSKRLFFGTLWGYVLMGASILYGLASIPIALSYLPLEKFGLWAVTQQALNFLTLVDLGFSSALARLLIEHKDEPGGAPYHSMVRMSQAVMLAQGGIILLLGIGLAIFLPGFMDIVPELKRTFAGLLALQALVIAAGFAMRFYGQILYAHHRLDIDSGINACGFAIQFVVLWLSFHLGAGVFSLVWASAATFVTTTAARMVVCRANGFLPRRGGKASFSSRQFREAFSFGAGLFGVSLGGVLIMSTQAMLIGKFIGLAEAGIWSVCTRPFTIMLPFIWRPFDSSFTMFSEMVVRRESARLVVWFTSLGRFTFGMAFIAAVTFAVCNAPFVWLWTSGRVSWPEINNTLLALWVPLLTFSHCASWVIQATKKLKLLPWICFLEGAFFMAATSLVGNALGYAGIILCSIVASLLFTVPYSCLRLGEILDQPVRQLCRNVLSPPAAVGIIMVLAALPAMLLTHNMGSPGLLFFIRCCVMGLFAVGMLRFTLDDPLRRRLLEQIPPHFYGMASFLVGKL